MEDLPPGTELRTDGPKAPPMSLPARLLNLFAIPGDVFDEVKSRPASVGNWLAPALLLVAVSWLGAWLVLSQPSVQQQWSEMADQIVQKQAEKMHMNDEQKELQRSVTLAMLKVAPFAGPVFAAFVSPFAWGLILWLVGVRGLKAQFPFMKAVEVAGLANAVAVLEAIIKTLLIVGLGNALASPSPALLVKHFDPKNPSHALLAVANVMTFWVLAVRSIGLARLSGVSFARAAIWVFGIWLTYTSVLLGMGIAAEAAFGG